jgi:hypothetical protein
MFFFHFDRTIIQERQFESICIRLLNAKRHIINVKNALSILKRDKPKVVSNCINTQRFFYPISLC